MNKVIDKGFVFNNCETPCICLSD